MRLEIPQCLAIVTHWQAFRLNCQQIPVKPQKSSQKTADKSKHENLIKSLKRISS